MYYLFAMLSVSINYPLHFYAHCKVLIECFLVQPLNDEEINAIKAEIS